MTGIFGISVCPQQNIQQKTQYNTQLSPRYNPQFNTRSGTQSGTQLSSIVGYGRDCQDKPKSGRDTVTSGATAKQREQVKQLLRKLKEQADADRNPFAAKKDDKTDGFTDLLGVNEDEKEKEKSDKPVVYNYKEVASKIQRAKTSVSASQAVLAAKRKVMEVKRKISSGNGDPEELQLALTHAKRMEMVARKKKNHLELEEMSSASVKRNEREDKQEDALNELKNSMIAAQEEKVGNLEDKIFDRRQEMIGDAAGGSLGAGIPASPKLFPESYDEMLSELNEMISEFGEEELKELEEAMEMLEDMEFVDPHMTGEDLDEMKKKHRMSEQKAMVKADMDYLKGMIKVSASVPAAYEGVSIDVSV